MLHNDTAIVIPVIVRVTAILVPAVFLLRHPFPCDLSGRGVRNPILGLIEFAP
jgi:hypothetical protein